MSANTDRDDVWTALGGAVCLTCGNVAPKVIESMTSYVRAYQYYCSAACVPARDRVLVLVKDGTKRIVVKRLLVRKHGRHLFYIMWPLNQ